MTVFLIGSRNGYWERKLSFFPLREFLGSWRPLVPDAVSSSGGPREPFSSQSVSQSSLSRLSEATCPSMFPATFLWTVMGLHRSKSHVSCFALLKAPVRNTRGGRGSWTRGEQSQAAQRHSPGAACRVDGHRSWRSRGSHSRRRGHRVLLLLFGKRLGGLCSASPAARLPPASFSSAVTTPPVAEWPPSPCRSAELRGSRASPVLPSPVPGARKGLAGAAEALRGWRRTGRRGVAGLSPPADTARRPRGWPRFHALAGTRSTRNSPFLLLMFLCVCENCRLVDASS